MAGSGRSGTAFGVDLYVLYKAGRVHLPVVAQEFAGACDLLAWSSRRESQAFSGSEYFGVDVFQKWTGLRDALQNVLADASDGLFLTGEALCAAANEYARVDEGAAAEMSRLMVDDGNPDVDAPVFLEAPRPGDPPWSTAGLGGMDSDRIMPG